MKGSPLHITQTAGWVKVNNHSHPIMSGAFLNGASVNPLRVNYVLQGYVRYAVLP